MGTMNVIHQEDILQHRKNTNGSSHHSRNLDPLPHLLNFLLGRMFRGIHDFFLATDTGSELGDGLGFHFGLGSETGDGLIGSALDGGCALAGD